LGIQIPVEMAEVGYRLTKLGINLQDFEDGWLCSKT
jgi:hypothetical protein